MTSKAPDSIEFTIRRLNVDDASAYRELRIEAVRNEPLAFGASYEDEAALPENFYHERFKSRWARESDAIFGAFDRQMNMFGHVGIYRRDGIKRVHRAGLWGMYVARTNRRSGAGRGLVKAALDFAKQIPVEFVDLAVVTDNHPAVALYESFGFEIWGREPAALKVDSMTYDEFYMTLKL